MHVIGTSARPDLPLTVVVGAGALGTAVARRMALCSRVLLVDVDGARAEAEAERLRGEGCDAGAFACDITDGQAVAALAAHVAQGGGFRTVVQVAGISPSGGDFRTIVTVNLHGAALVAAALRPLAAPGSAAIMVSSLGAHLSNPTPEAAAVLRQPERPDLADALLQVLGADAATPTAAYSLAKWGMNLMCRRQAPAWGERGARIVSISPGLIATPMGAREFAASEAKRQLYGKSPLLRECTMLEIADVIEFLASPRAAFISGTDLRVDGGLAAAVLDG